MKNILLIGKKELVRFFSDIRLVLSVMILPGLIIFLTYFFAGSQQTDYLNSIENEIIKISIVNSPVVFDEHIKQVKNTEIKNISSDYIEDCKISIRDEEIDLLVVFPESFNSKLEKALSTKTEPCQIEIFYNSLSIKSATAFEMTENIIQSIENSIYDLIDINSKNNIYDLANDNNKLTNKYASTIPTCLLMCIFLGSIPIAEAIAVEKERKTLDTLLISPVKKYEIIFGKIYSMSIISLLSGMSGFFGSILSLPYILNIDSDNISVGMYGIKEYTSLFIVVLSSVFAIVSIIIFLSTISKTVKEAQSYMTPCMLLSSIAGISTMFSTEMPSIEKFLLPIYNSALSFNGIISLNFDVKCVFVTVLTNILFAILLAVLSSVLLKKEKIVFPN